MFKFLKFMELPREEIDNFKKEKSGNPNSNSLYFKRRKRMNRVMTNEELINVLKLLKNEGISYCFIARKCEISKSTFYNYIYRNNFPYFMREVITNFIIDNFSEVLKDVGFQI